MQEILLHLYTEHNQPPIIVETIWDYTIKRGELIIYQEHQYLVNNIIHNVDKHTVNIHAIQL